MIWLLMTWLSWLKVSMMTPTNTNKTKMTLDSVLNATFKERSNALCVTWKESILRIMFWLMKNLLSASTVRRHSSKKTRMSIRPHAFLSNSRNELTKNRIKQWALLIKSWKELKNNPFRFCTDKRLTSIKADISTHLSRLIIP